jgi:ATP-dependent RNA helicase HelY
LTDKTIASFLSTLPFEPDPFQLDAIEALSSGQSVLVAAPTGTGKTVVAEFAVHQALSMGRRALYTTPIKALSNQKFRDFRAVYGGRVGLLTGDLVENPGGRLLVMTTEVARNMLVQDRASFQDVGCLIFDEVHYLADPERGTAWEESILLTPPHVQLVCLSATVGNVDEVAEWMSTTGKEVALVESFERAVPLKHRYFMDGHLYPVLEGGARLPAFRAVPPSPRRRGSRGGDGRAGAGRSPELEFASPPQDVVKALGDADLLPAIYFFFARKLVEGAAEACRRLSLLSQREAAQVRRAVQERLATMPAEDRSLDQVSRLATLLPKGIGFHHAGLLPPLKTLVEELLAAGILRAVFATDTLALGINVPARSVVLGEMAKFDGQVRRLLTPGEYRQLTGRAGRRGMDPVGYAVLLPSPWVGLDQVLEVATGPVAPLESAFRPGYSTVLNLWDRPGDDERLASLIAGSLRQFQEGGKIRALIEERDQVSRALSTIPDGCPICGDPVAGMQQEKQLKREQDSSESAVNAVQREMSALEDRLSSWPWRYSKTQRREWIRSARPGEMAFSRRRGWMAYLGPAIGGVGSFLVDGSIEAMGSYGEIDYIPNPALLLPLPESVVRQAAMMDGAMKGSTRDERDAMASAMREMRLPDVEAMATEISEAARAESAGALESLQARLEEARERRREATLALAGNPYRACPHRPEHRRTERERRSQISLLAALERDLAAARKEASRRAHRILRSLRSVLESFDYMAAGQPAPRAESLKRLFDSNSLIIAELMNWGLLSDATPPEVAEVASWFAFDREGSGRPLPLTARLTRYRAAAEDVSKQVMETERRFGIDLSSARSAEFKGVGLAWATGMSLADLSARSGLPEGDLVFALQKTIDLCKQIRQAAPYCRTPSLAPKAAEAEQLLRRGVVDSYYRWVVEAPS